MAPVIPIWAGCLLTCLDVMIVLLVFQSYPSKTTSTSMRIFEFIVGFLILVVLACMAVLMHRLEPHWGTVFRSYLPTKQLFGSGGVYQSISMYVASHCSSNT
jgi:metal iron transporter